MGHCSSVSRALAAKAKCPGFNSQRCTCYTAIVLEIHSFSVDFTQQSSCSQVYSCKVPVPYNVACGCLYSSEEQEQSQGKGNAQVEVDKVVELFN